MTQFLEQLQSHVHGTYSLERELSGGGMSRVFVAHETALGRDVCIKVLPAELAEGLSAQRFVREIRLAASLQQANIVPVLAAGVAGNLPYYVMPFVEGKSLRVMLAQRTQLPVHETVGILRDVARALAFAHGHGVVHRDIKPENVLLSGDTAVVTDFGIAKAVSASLTDEGATTLTAIGTTIGTPAYMAPEQVAGDPHIDHRADIYAWGLIAYELLAGRHPFWNKKTSHELRAAHLNEVPERLDHVAKQVPPALSALVMRCLEKDPAARPASATELVHALDESVSGESESIARGSRRTRWLAIAGAAVAITAATLLWQNRSGAGGAGGAAGATAPTRLAVLPFENTGRSEDDYFADGITDEVRGKLAAIPGLQVVARSSSRSYLKSGKKLEDIARELGVDYVLTGTVRWETDARGAAGRVRVTPELVQLLKDNAPSTKWQQPFEAALSNVFQVQSDIAGRVAQALDVALGASERARIAERPTANLEAYDSYLQGEDASNGMGAGALPKLRQAIRFYERATRLDSTFVNAWARLASARAVLYGNSAPDPELLRSVRSAAERAIALAPNAAAGHTAMGMYYTLGPPDPRRALAELSKALKVAPNDAVTFEATAVANQLLGRWEDALVLQQRAATFDPRGIRTVSRVGTILLWLRRYDEARTAMDRAVALAPTVAVVVQQRAMLELALGSLEGARAVFARVPDDGGRDALIADVATYWDLGWALSEADQRRLLSLTPVLFNDDRGSWALAIMQAYALHKDAARARAYADSARIAFEEQVRGTPDDGQTHVLLGLALAELGQRNAAIREGELAVKLLPVARDARQGPYVQHQLVRIYTRTGEIDKAIDTLEPLLRIPYYLSPAWLRIDPNFDPLRTNPRFARLANGAGS
jgi:TolB-like protein/Flp pilus assembly protein TadD